MALLCLTACGSQLDEAAGSGPTDVGATVGIADGSWLSMDVTRAGRPLDLVPGTRVRLSLTVKRVSADAGCNSMSGAATYANGVLHVADDSLAITEMGCTRARMDQDDWLAAFLTSGPRLEVRRGQLTLSTGDTTVSFTDLPAESPASPSDPLDPDSPTSN